ncbi:hypothetical protein QUA56_23345 [Microcoleus sp. N3A4]
MVEAVKSIACRLAIKSIPALENPPDRALNADRACGFNRESPAFRLARIAAGDRSTDREPPTLFKFSLYLCGKIKRLSPKRIGVLHLQAL